MEFGETPKALRLISRLSRSLSEQSKRNWDLDGPPLGESFSATRKPSSFGPVLERHHVQDLRHFQRQEQDALWNGRSWAVGDELLRGLKNSLRGADRRFRLSVMPSEGCSPDRRPRDFTTSRKPFADFTATLVLNDRTMEVITSAFEALFSAAKLVLIYSSTWRRSSAQFLFGAFHILTTVLGIAIRSTGGLVGVIRDAVNCETCTSLQSVRARDFRDHQRPSNRMADAMARNGHFLTKRSSSPGSSRVHLNTPPHGGRLTGCRRATGGRR